MTGDMFDKMGPLLSAIGEQAAADLGGDPDGIYVYAEADEGWHSDNVFRLEEDGLKLYWASQQLGDLIWELWNLGDAGKRWAVMEYEIRGDQFAVEFRYPEEVDVDDVEKDHRAEAVSRRFGDIPIIYPPWTESLD